MIKALLVGALCAFTGISFDDDQITPGQKRVLSAFTILDQSEERCGLSLNSSSISLEIAKSGLEMRAISKSPYIDFMSEYGASSAAHYGAVGKERFCQEVREKYGPNGTLLPGLAD